MTRFAQMFTCALLLATTAGTPRLVAQSADLSSYTWLAASSSEPTIGSAWGRLIMKDGVLAFRSTDSEWDIPVTEIKRAAVSAQSDKLLVIERNDGALRYVAIIGTSMLVDSPRKTLDAIQRAMRGPVSRRF
jgi:hypothetical protein